MVSLKPFEDYLEHVKSHRDITNIIQLEDSRKENEIKKSHLIGLPVRVRTIPGTYMFIKYWFNLFILDIV